MTGFLTASPDAYRRDELDTRPSLNSSVLKVLLGQSPAHARERHPRLTTTPEYDWPETNAMKIGSVAHAILLGVGARYVSFDPAQFLTKKGEPGKTLGSAEAKAAIEAARARGEIDIDKDTHRDAENVADRMLRAITEEYPLWQYGVSESVVLWQYRLNDGTFALCRAQLDRRIDACSCVGPTEYRIDADEVLHELVREGGEKHLHIFDCKFTGKSATDDWLDRTIAMDGWDIQDAFYSLGAASVQPLPVVFTFIVGETYPPYDTRFVTLPESWRSTAKQRVDIGVNRWAQCIDSGIWPGRPRRYEPKPPEWLAARWMFELVGAEE